VFLPGIFAFPYVTEPEGDARPVGDDFGCGPGPLPGQAGPGHLRAVRRREVGRGRPDPLAGGGEARGL